MKSWLAQGSEYFLNLFLDESAFRPEKPIVVSVRSSQKKMRHERNCKALLRLELAAILNHVSCDLANVIQSLTCRSKQSLSRPRCAIFKHSIKK